MTKPQYLNNILQRQKWEAIVMDSKLFDYHEIILKGGGKVILFLPVPLDSSAKESLKARISGLIDLAVEELKGGDRSE